MAEPGLVSEAPTARGLYPDGDINAFLRIGGLDEERSSGSGAEDDASKGSG